MTHELPMRCPRCGHRNTPGYRCACQLSALSLTMPDARGPGSTRRAIGWLVFLLFCSAIVAIGWWWAAVMV